VSGESWRQTYVDNGVEEDREKATKDVQKVLQVDMLN